MSENRVPTLEDLKAAAQGVPAGPDLNTKLAPMLLARAIEQRGPVLAVEMDCEVFESAPPGTACVHREPGRFRLSFLFAAPGEDGTRPADEFIPLSPPGVIFGAEKEAFLSRMAALYDEHGEPEEYEDDPGGHRVFKVVFQMAPLEEIDDFPARMVASYEQNGRPDAEINGRSLRQIMELPPAERDAELLRIRDEGAALLEAEAKL